MSSKSVSLSADWVLGLGSHVGDYDVAAGDEGDDANNGDDGDEEEEVVMMMKMKVIMMKMKLMMMRAVMRGWG